MTYEHIQYLDLHGNDVELECVVLREFENGDIAYIQLNELDRIDLDRLRNIVTKRNAPQLALWDLMNSTTLRNGENALIYFDQMVMVKTQSGELIPPRAGQRGALIGARMKKPAKKAGRPPKSK